MNNKLIEKSVNVIRDAIAECGDTATQCGAQDAMDRVVFVLNLYREKQERIWDNICKQARGDP